MCKVFLGDFGFVCRGLGDLEGAEGVDRFWVGRLAGTLYPTHPPSAAYGWGTRRG